MNIKTEPALDRADTRVRHDTGLAGAIRCIPGPRPVGRPGITAGRGRARDHLDGVPEPQPGFPVEQQLGQPAVQLVDRRRDFAGHRLRLDGRRDRSLGRLGQRLRLGARGSALGEQRLAGRRLDPGGARGRCHVRLDLRRVVQSAGNAELRFHPGGPARDSGHAALHPGRERLDQPALWFDAGESRPDARHAACRGLRARADRGCRDVRDRLPHRRPPPRSGPDAAFADRPAVSHGRVHGGASNWSSSTSTATAASPGCSACLWDSWWRRTTR